MLFRGYLECPQMLSTIKPKNERSYKNERRPSIESMDGRV